MTGTRTADVVVAYGKAYDHVATVRSVLSRAQRFCEMASAEAEAKHQPATLLTGIEHCLEAALAELCDLPGALLALERTAHACGVDHAAGTPAHVEPSRRASGAATRYLVQNVSLWRFEDA